jgi:Fe-S oxidoreductase
MGKALIPSGLTLLADNIASKQNILGVSKEQSARWAKGLNLPKRGETIFFAGCGYQFSSQMESLLSLIRQMDKSSLGTELPMRLGGFQKKLGINLTGIYSRVMAKGDDNGIQPLEAAVKVLRGFGVEPGYLAEDEPCCGAPLYHAGLHREFAENARQAYQKMKSFGVRRVIGIVPYCTHALLKLWPRYVEGYDLEVKHFLEVVAGKMSSRELRFPRQVKVAYHDPCQLVRYLRLAEEPRRILKSIKGIELVEPEWTKREWATCCGGGGGFEVVFPELSQILATNRARELIETGAEIIATNCPGCLLQLKNALKEIKADKVAVLDLAQILAMSLGD